MAGWYPSSRSAAWRDAGILASLDALLYVQRQIRADFVVEVAIVGPHASLQTAVVDGLRP
jgi:hypothetical protein